MPEARDETSAQLRITPEEARHVANLLRYAVSLNTAVGLISPTERRLATSTYKAVELAALVLEGRTFEEAAEEASRAWTGSLEDEHRRALELLQSSRDELIDVMTGRLAPERIAEYLEVAQDQLVELTRSGARRPRQNRSMGP